MELERELRRVLDPRRVLTRPIERIAFAGDASVYRLVPRAVVLPRTIEEIRALFRLSHALEIPLTFRAAGTSLSGQAITDGILVVVSRDWDEVAVEDGGRRVRFQPGVIGDVVNRHLRPFGARIGPDPASINACMMGGILANNSSGMCCGVSANAYHTLRSIRVVLPDGLVVDTAAPDADERLHREAPALAEGLLALRRRIEADAALRERIRAKYRMKNTNGYSLNAFLDHERAVEILGHLMIGSEGTLGFIAEATLDTVPDHPLKSTGLLFFEDVPRACAAIAALRDSGARALELMDRASLRAIADRRGVPGAIRDLPARAAALLVEYQCETADELEARRGDCRAVLDSLPLLAGAEFTEDPARQAALWRVRKGLIPSVGAMRRRGTSFILEDVVFPLPRLAEGVSDLQALFARHGYDDAIVFGHAKDGNLHFVLVQAFDDPRDVERYGRLMVELAEVVVGRHDGALKAEHGTGRNMAPFVLAEWGAEALAVMRELKRLIDPRGLLNPGVILNDDPRAHLRHLKDLPRVEQEVDACIECGFCERACPSRELTLTPRQRIAVRREMARLRARPDSAAALGEIERDFDYAALDTCAADGMCATLCPVDIDTGALVKRLRGEALPAFARALTVAAADRMAWIEPLARLALRVRGAWDDELPAASAAPAAATSRAGATAVCFPSCVSRVVGPDRGADRRDTVAALVARVAGRAGQAVWVPDDAAGVCCGLAFGSRGWAGAAERAVARAVDRLWDWTERGRLPVVVDTSPCALTLKRARPLLDRLRRARHEALEILDGIEYAERLIEAGLAIRRRKRAVALHPVCSVQQMELGEALERVAGCCAERTTVPIRTGCCGFAGDRGLRHPELTAAATRPAAREIERAGALDGHYSTSRTCEIAMKRATGRAYRSLWSLLDEVSA